MPKKLLIFFKLIKNLIKLDIMPVRFAKLFEIQLQQFLRNKNVFSYQKCGSGNYVEKSNVNLRKNNATFLTDYNLNFNLIQ
jgi:hypothetical protein